MALQPRYSGWNPAAAAAWGWPGYGMRRAEQRSIAEQSGAERSSGAFETRQNSLETQPQATCSRGEVLEFLFLQLFILGLRGRRTQPRTLHLKLLNLNRQEVLLSEVQTKVKRSRKMKGRPCELKSRGCGS